MTSVMIALLLTVWSLPAQGSPPGMSTNEATFLSLFNGNFDNLDQSQADTSKNYIQFRSIPVTTPALPGRTVLFIDWLAKDVVYKMFLCDVREDTKRDIYLDIYNFTDTSIYKPGVYKLEDLPELKPQDIRRIPECTAKYIPSGPGKFMGTWPACRHLITGKPAQYVNIITCHSVEIFIPVSAEETSARTPYDMVSKGDKYKVPGAPDGFVSPCK